MNFLKLDNLGGLPFTQDRLQFLHEAYVDSFKGFAKLCGDKTILSGVVVTGGTDVSDGYIVVDGEPLPFIGGSVAAKVKITETAVPFTFADTVSKNVQFSRYASCAASGDFDFSLLTPLLSLQNIWLPGDMKEKIFADGATADAYIAANFDPATGIGINEQRGWAIVTKIYPDTAGKVMVPVDAADANLNQVGKMFGSKTHTLTIAQMPAHNHKIYGTDNSATVNTPNGELAQIYDPGTPIYTTTKNTETVGGGAAHNIMQPTYAILKLVKL